MFDVLKKMNITPPENIILKSSFDKNGNPLQHKIENFILHGLEDFEHEFPSQMNRNELMALYIFLINKGQNEQAYADIYFDNNKLFSNQWIRDQISQPLIDYKSDLEQIEADIKNTKYFIKQNKLGKAFGRTMLGKGLTKSKTTRKMKISSDKGISHKKIDHFIPFGKHLLHYPKLLEGEFNLRYKSGANHAKFPVARMTGGYKDFMTDFIDSHQINDRLLHVLPDLEQTHFKNLLRETGLSSHFKVKTNHEPNEKADHERFLILQGEIQAGNNNAKMISEFKNLLIKFGQTGKLNKKQVSNALKVLSNISK
jgi:hypothetical protein